MAAEGVSLTNRKTIIEKQKNTQNNNKDIKFSYKTDISILLINKDIHLSENHSAKIKLSAC